MATAENVAAYMLAQRRVMSGVRLQKLLYYAQAWHLVTMDSPLYDDDITAFEYGPVVRSVWMKHRSKITVKWSDHLGEPDALTDAEREVVDAVLHAYRENQPFDLADLTHREDPWQDAWNDPHDKRISNEAMQRYYSKDSVKPASERTTTKIPRVPQARVSYVSEDEFASLSEPLDEAGDVRGFLAALKRIRG